MDYSILRSVGGGGYNGRKGGRWGKAKARDGWRFHFSVLQRKKILSRLKIRGNRGKRGTKAAEGPLHLRAVDVITRFRPEEWKDARGGGGGNNQRGREDAESEGGRPSRGFSSS